MRAWRPLLTLLLTAALGLAAASARAGITFVGGGFVDGGNATSISFTRPAGSTTDDVLLVQVTAKQNGSNRGISPPAGWHNARADNVGRRNFVQRVFWRVVAAGDPMSYTFTTSYKDQLSGSLLAYRGVDIGHPIDVSAGQRNARGSTTVVAPNVKTSRAYDMLVAFFGIEDGNASFTLPGSMSARGQIGSSGGPNGVASAAADELFSARGNTGTRTAIASLSAANVGQMVALRGATTFLVEAAGGGPIGSQVAGISFSIQVTAVDPGGNVDTGFTGRATITSTGTLSAGGGTTPRFKNGVLASYPVTISNVGSFNITATSGRIVGVSNAFTVIPQLQILVPGETAAPGTLAGYTGTPAQQTAGVPFNVTVNAVDQYWNVVPTASDVVTLTSSDAAAVLPGPTALANGTGTFTVTLNTPPSQTVSATGSLSRVNQSPPIPLTGSAGTFNACDAGAANCNGTTPSTYITTKVAGAGFNLDLVALNGTGALNTAYKGKVQVELLDASNNSAALDSNNCRSSWTPIYTLTGTPQFKPADNGRITVGPFTVANSYPDVRVRVIASGGAPIGCSTDDFAIRPDHFVLTVSDSNWTTAGTTRSLNDVTFGSVTHKAGQPFSVRAQAVNAAGVVTTDYSGTPTVLPAACSGAACTATFGTFTLGAAFSGGQLSSDVATYTEVGSLEVQLVDDSFAAVDQSDGSTLAQRQIASTPLAVGRFVPDHFDLESTTPAPTLTNRADLTCTPASSFSYMNEPMQAQFKLWARNAAGAATLNYTGAWARLALTGPGALNFGAVSGATDLTSRLVFGSTAGTWSAGAATVTQQLAVGRASPDNPDGPYPNTAVGIAPSDSDGVQLVASAYDLNVDGAGGNDHARIGSPTEIRFGRLVVQNALGSGQTTLPVPIETQYWNGTTFATNASDSCTSIARSAFMLDGYVGSLDPTTGGCKTYIVQDPVTFSAGVGALRFAAPAGGATGSVRLTANLYTTASGSYCSGTGGAPVAATAADMTYLLGRWNDSLNPDGSSSTNYDDDPVARAAFGLYGSVPQNFIFQRENY